MILGIWEVFLKKKWLNSVAQLVSREIPKKATMDVFGFVNNNLLLSDVFALGNRIYETLKEVKIED